MENKTPKVSVIIPTYNRARYICEAVESVLNQTYKDYEIIIIDDGSTDNTKQVLDEYLLSKGFKIDNKENYCLYSLTAKPYTLIRYIYQENKGEAGARNRGIKEAKGEYIAFLDSDDLWRENKLEKQIVIIESSKDIDLVYCAMQVLRNGIIENSLKPAEPAFNFFDLLLEGKSIPMTMIIRKRCFSEIDWFDENIKLACDYEMWLRFTLKYKVKFLDEPLAICRRHDSNISGDIGSIKEYGVKIFSKLLKREDIPKDMVKRKLSLEYYVHLGKYIMSKNDIKMR